jgi:glycosyltransferase involved in cell wall biosynthesis
MEVTRVLLVHQPVDGGVARHVADLAAGLGARGGYEVVLCGPELPVGVPASCAHAQLDLQRAVGARVDALALAQLVWTISRIRPHVIHAHSSKAGAVARIARLAHPRIPVLYTPHGYAFAGHFSRELERRAYREIERVLALATSRVVCVCEAEARLARTVTPAERVRVVHNGIGSLGDGPTDPRIVELASRGPVLCALTLLRPGKGLETLLDALPQVLERHPHLQVAIGGEGPDGEALRARALARGIESAVHFLGGVEDPASVLRGAQVFVHPSWAEAFPYVILEAMSAGLPIVASDVGGVGEALVDGESGLLVARGDERALAGALGGLLADRERGERLGAAARQRVEDLFTTERMIDGTRAVYDELNTHPPTGA